MEDTAVKFLIDEISCRFIISEELRIAMYKAKKMEKEQIVDFAEKWSKEILRSDRNINIEQYYNETFKSE